MSGQIRRSALFPCYPNGNGIEEIKGEEMPPRTFTKKEKAQLQKAFEVMQKAEKLRPFERALTQLELYENAAKGIKAQETIDNLNRALGESNRDCSALLDENMKLKIELHKYKNDSLWFRFKLFWTSGGWRI